MTRQEYHIASIELEIYELTTYRKNLKKFVLLEMRQSNMMAKKFYSIFDEVDRVTMEIYELENKKLEIFNLRPY
jgi:hypothetical protein